MKKGLLFILLCMVVLVGCENKSVEQRLVCTQKIETTTADMIIDYNDNKLTYLGIKYVFDISSHTKEEKDILKKQDMCKTIIESAKKTSSNDITNCKQNATDDSIIITADVDISTLTKEELEKYSGIQLVKENFEKENYSCVLTSK